jgi:hypothetical protein
MIKPTLYLFAITLLSSLVSGCVGYVHVTPTECSADLPIVDYIYEKDKWGPINRNIMTSTTLPDKDDFIKEWGEPDETIKVSDDETTLVYKRKIWCGSVPAYIIPVPLVLPTCDGFDRITFKGDTATHIHFKRSDSSGIMFPIGAEGSRACPHTYTKITVPTYSKGDDIPDNKGLVVLYRPKSFVGSAGRHIVKVEENLLVPLYNGSYYKYLSTVGEKEFTYRNFSWQKHLKINIEQKQKYYLRFKIIFPTGTSLEEVPAEIAEKEIEGLTLSIPQK